MSEISIIKTLSGEEIIGTVTYRTDFLLVEDALVFVQRSSAGEVGIQLVRYMPYAEDTSVKLDRASVVCIVKASNRMSEFYKVSVIYNELFTKKIDAGIADASVYMKLMLEGDGGVKEDIFKKMSADILNNFSSNTKPN